MTSIVDLNARQVIDHGFSQICHFFGNQPDYVMIRSDCLSIRGRLLHTTEAATATILVVLRLLSPFVKLVA